MIYLRTGANGTGKTSGLLGELYDDITVSDRKLYVHGIKDLAIDHTPLVCDNPICDVCPDLKRDNPNHLRLDVWYQVCDKGSLIVVDEAQLHYNLAYKKQSALDSFDIHRHNGQDVYFLCPHPMKLAIGLRRLVANHQHIFYDFLGRHKYTWYECSQSLAKSSAESKRYKLDKRAFSLYTSASEHTQLERKVPFLVFVIIAAILTASFFGYKIYSKLSDKAAPPPPPPVSAPRLPPPPSSSVPSPSGTSQPIRDMPEETKFAHQSAQQLTQQSHDDFIAGVPVGRAGSHLLVPSYAGGKCKGYITKASKTYRFCQRDGEIYYVAL
jgi:zona occludens toxin